MCYSFWYNAFTKLPAGHRPATSWVHYTKTLLCFASLCRSKVTVLHTQYVYLYSKRSSPVTGLEWPRGFQEVKVPRFNDNGTGRW